MSETDGVIEFSPTAKTEEWVSDVKRLIRRSAIYQNMSPNYPWKRQNQVEIAHTVANYEKNIGVDDLVNSLVNSELAVDPKIAEIAQNTSASIRLKFPQVSAIILLGSSAHGGALIREASGTPPSDFDWGILSNDYVDAGETLQIINFAGKKIQSEGKRLHMGRNFKSCTRYNPMEKRALNLKDQTVAYKAVERLGHKDIPRWEREDLLDPLLLYFQPSFPTPVNERNRLYVLSALSSLSLSDHDKWSHATSTIINKWGDYHLLKDKHLKIVPKNTDWKLARQVVFHSSEVMSQAMAELIQSTDATRT